MEFELENIFGHETLAHLLSIGTIRLSSGTSLYRLTKTVNLLHRAVSASNLSKASRWWKYACANRR